MYIAFDPPLRVSNDFYLPSNLKCWLTDNEDARSHAVTLKLKAKVSRDDFNELTSQRAVIQVWSDLPSSTRPTGEWGATDFTIEGLGYSNGDAAVSTKTEPDQVLSLVPESQVISESDHHGCPDITLQASFFIPFNLPAGRSFQYTYRIIYPDGGIWWQGEGEAGNGNLVFHNKVFSPPIAIAAESRSRWEVDEALISTVELSGADALLSKEIEWTGWVIGYDG